MSLKERFESFYQRVKAYRALLIESRSSYMSEIVKNKEKIEDERQGLIREYAKLDEHIKLLGNNPKISDGVWNIWYSPYSNAFTTDLLIRVGRSLDAVISDLDWIIGKLEANTEEINKVTPNKVDMKLDELQSLINSAINLAEQKLLSGKELNELVDKLKAYDFAKIEHEILRRKLEKLQKTPQTVWSDTQGYAVGAVELLTPWRELLLETNPDQEKVQEYFRPGSREEIYEYLKSLIPGAQIIKIYDNYVGEEILKLLEMAPKESKVYILGKDFKPSFLKKFLPFQEYFDRDIKAKKTNKAHMRFYIVDGNVYHVDTSLSGPGADKATMISPVAQIPAKKMTEDYEEWWNSAEEIK